MAFITNTNNNENKEINNNNEDNNNNDNKKDNDDVSMMTMTTKNDNDGDTDDGADSIIYSIDDGRQYHITNSSMALDKLKNSSVTFMPMISARSFIQWESVIDNLICILQWNKRNI